MNVWNDSLYVYIVVSNVSRGSTDVWYTISTNNRFIGVIRTGACVALPLKLFYPGNNRIVLSKLTLRKNADTRTFHLFHKESTYVVNDDSNRFLAGDILIACDNRDGTVGYMGHAAIAVDSLTLVEAVPHHPQVRRDTIQQFIDQHPHYEVYRPKQKEMGRQAAAFAVRYVNQFNENQKFGVPVPEYSLSQTIQLDEPTKYIYCSKLVWLCYYYGAHYKFYNDFLWFAPEDLDECLENDSNFVLLYKHPDFHFKVNA